MKKFAILVILLVAIALASADDKGKGKRVKKCNGEAMTVSEDFRKAKKECKKKFVQTNEDGSKNKNKNCVALCQWKKDGTVKADGTYDSAGSKKLIQSMYPKAVHSEIAKAVDACAEANKGSFNNKEDDNCASYKAFRKCQKKAVKKICKGDEFADDDTDDSEE